MVGKKVEWEQAKAMLAVGQSVQCRVVQHQPFGILVSVNDRSLSGVIERVRMERDGFRTPDDYPPVGSTVDAAILGFRDWSQQIELALEPSGRTGTVECMEEELLEVGLRFGPEHQLEFFGIDEVNERIRSGERVKAIEKGRALMTKSGENDHAVNIRFEGFSILVVLE